MRIILLFNENMDKLRLIFGVLCRCSSSRKGSQDYTYISAEHNINIEILFDKIKEMIPFTKGKHEIDNTEKSPGISFIGKPNVGKSFTY